MAQLADVGLADDDIVELGAYLVVYPLAFIVAGVAADGDVVDGLTLPCGVVVGPDGTLLEAELLVLIFELREAE